MRINSLEQWIVSGIFGGILLAMCWGIHMEIRMTRIEDSQQVIVNILNKKLAIPEFTLNDKNDKFTK